MIKPIKTYLKKSESKAIFHDSRQDSATLRKVCNELIDKVNELTEKVNELSSDKKE